MGDVFSRGWYLIDPTRTHTSSPPREAMSPSTSGGKKLSTRGDILSLRLKFPSLTSPRYLYQPRSHITEASSTRGNTFLLQLQLLVFIPSSISNGTNK
jgi:hypothetical protein